MALYQTWTGGRGMESYIQSQIQGFSCTVGVSNLLCHQAVGIKNFCELSNQEVEQMQCRNVVIEMRLIYKAWILIPGKLSLCKLFYSAELHSYPEHGCLCIVYCSYQQWSMTNPPTTTTTWVYSLALLLSVSLERVHNSLERA